MDVLLNSLVVYYTATWATFKPILKKQKNLPTPKKLNKTPLGNYEMNDKIMHVF